VDLVTSLAATTNIEELGIVMGTAVAGETEGLSRDNGASLPGDAPAAVTDVAELAIEMGIAVAGETEGPSKDNSGSLPGDTTAVITEGKWKDRETACSGALSPDTAGGMTIGRYKLGLVVVSLLGMMTGGITTCGGVLS
jgi:hypothetical protein